jgi:mRNA-degrading endonuclease RelE of RelBE toxin-antitoxin system
VRVEISDQVLDFVRRQAPEPRRRLRLALRNLGSERGDVKALEGPLRGYLRLRVGPYRVLFAYSSEHGRRQCIRCLFAERRDIVYEVFSRVLQQRLLEES